MAYESAPLNPTGRQFAGAVEPDLLKANRLKAGGLKPGMWGLKSDATYDFLSYVGSGFSRISSVSRLIVTARARHYVPTTKQTKLAQSVHF